MSIESHADWEGLRAAARVARLTLDTLAKQVKAGVTTGELDETAAHLFAAHRARSMSRWRRTATSPTRPEALSSHPPVRSPTIWPPAPALRFRQR